MAEFKIGAIQPNPFRHLERYPIKREKIEALRESMRTTGFWDNLVARINGDGPELAYGHHRLVALEEEFGPDRVVSLNIRDLDDQRMLQIMARENNVEWGSSAAVEQETVRAVVEAYAEGKINFDLWPLDPKASDHQIRHAPSFRQGDASDAHRTHPYTAQQVAGFLGWLEPSGRAAQKVLEALSALELIEEGILSEDNFAGLSTTGARAVITEARKRKRLWDGLAKQAEQEAKQAKREAKQAAKRAANAETADERRQAEQEQEAAKKRAKAAGEQSEGRRKQAKDSASSVGQGVSEALQDGKIGSKQAADEAYKYEPRAAKGPPEFGKFLRMLANSIGKIACEDKLAEKLDATVKSREYAPADKLAALTLELASASDRLLTYAAHLESRPVQLREPLALTDGRQ